MRERSHNQDMENNSPETDRNSPEYWDGVETDYDLPEDEDCLCIQTDVDMVDASECPIHGQPGRFVYPVMQTTPFDDDEVAF